MTSEYVRRTQELRRSGATIPVSKPRKISDEASIEEGLRDYDDAEWLYGNSPAGLRQRAAEELASEFGNDASEWLI
jgi:hypothetical protein